MLASMFTQNVVLHKIVASSKPQKLLERLNWYFVLQTITWSNLDVLNNGITVMLPS